jgi:hypothetical protein
VELSLAEDNFLNLIVKGTSFSFIGVNMNTSIQIIGIEIK